MKNTATVTAPVIPAPRPVSLFGGTALMRTSYANQRLLAVRELGQTAKCAHAEFLTDGCNTCRRSGSVLVFVS